MKDFAAAIGDRIRYYRTCKKMTQDDLADLADLHNTYIGQIERGEKNITAINLDRILDALDISYAEFYEPLDLRRDANHVPLTCYDLISSQPKKQQKQLLHIIEAIISISDHN